MIKSAIKRLWNEPDFAHEGGESNVQAAKRGLTALIYIVDKYIGKKIAVGTHGNIMTIIMNCFDQQYDYAFWKGLSMPDIYKLSFEDYDLVDVKRVWMG